MNYEKALKRIFFFEKSSCCCMYIFKLSACSFIVHLFFTFLENFFYYPPYIIVHDMFYPPVSKETKSASNTVGQSANLWLGVIKHGPSLFHQSLSWKNTRRFSDCLTYPKLHFPPSICFSQVKKALWFASPRVLASL